MARNGDDVAAVRPRRGIPSLFNVGGELTEALTLLGDRVSAQLAQIEALLAVQGRERELLLRQQGAIPDWHELPFQTSSRFRIVGIYWLPLVLPTAADLALGSERVIPFANTVITAPLWLPFQRIVESGTEIDGLPGVGGGVIGSDYRMFVQGFSE